MLFAELVHVSRHVADTGSRLAKLDLLARLLRRTPAGEAEIAIAFLSGVLRQGRLGVGSQMLQAARPSSAASTNHLTLSAVDQTLDRIKRIRGKGAALRKTTALRELLSQASDAEQDFLLRLMLGELRQGALAALMLEAVALAREVDAKKLRYAVMLAGGLGKVAHALFTEGTAGLETFSLRAFQPIQPMLAQPAKNIAAALDRLGEALFEYKLDGARIQAHKAGAEVRIYSRRLREVSGALPEIVASVRALPARGLVLDGEVIALDTRGRPRPFQATMRRFGRRDNVDELRAELPLSAFFFDILYLDGEALIGQTTASRVEILNNVVPQEMRMAATVTSSREQAVRFLRAARQAGHEGVMAKALDAPYAAGRRGAFWLKIKPAHTLDLVVLAAEWGHGRRRGWLSNLHLGARAAETGKFVMLGKTFKGLTDKMLAWQTQRLLELENRRKGHVVYVRPELVAEIAFNDIQESPQYPGGLALRFARVKRYRPDKSAGDADTMATVRKIR